MALTVLVRPKEKINLKDVIASGGEGDIYVDKGFAYKIYHDVVRALPIAKLDELTVLNSPSIIRPFDPVFDTSGKKLVGYRMREVTNAIPLAKYMTKSFKEKNSITPAMTTDLIHTFQSVVRFIHEKDILIVDLNEMNFAVSTTFDTVYCFDVDSYQTTSFPATALMEKVQDYHSARFSRLTDWYSFAIVTFNTFSGIHPFRGGHPNYKHLNNTDAMLQRMKDNVSVLHTGATVPAATLPFTVIPPVYLEWYRALFEEGKRLSPPTDIHDRVQQPVHVEVAQIIQGQTLKIEKLDEYSALIIACIPTRKVRTIITAKNVHFNTVKTLPCLSLPTRVIATPKRETLLAVSLDARTNRLILREILVGKTVECEMLADSFMTYHGRLYAKQADIVYEVDFIENGVTLHAVPRTVGSVSVKSSQLFEGVVMETLLGRPHAMMFPDTGISYTIGLPELEKLRILDAKYENKLLVVLAQNTVGSYNKYYFRMNAAHDAYDTWTEQDVDYHTLNFVVLDNGIVVEITDDGQLEVYQNVQWSQGRRQVIKDPAISGNTYLYHDGMQVLLSKENVLYSVKMS